MAVCGEETCPVQELNRTIDQLNTEITRLNVLNYGLTVEVERLAQLVDKGGVNYNKLLSEKEGLETDLGDLHRENNQLKYLNSAHDEVLNRNLGDDRNELQRRIGNQDVEIQNLIDIIHKMVQ